MTEHQPTPQGRTGQAWRTLLARCHKSEDKVRELRAENENLRAQIDAQEDQ